MKKIILFHLFFVSNFSLMYADEKSFGNEKSQAYDEIVSASRKKINQIDDFVDDTQAEISKNVALIAYTTKRVVGFFKKSLQEKMQSLISLEEVPLILGPDQEDLLPENKDSVNVFYAITAPTPSGSSKKNSGLNKSSGRISFVRNDDNFSSDPQYHIEALAPAQTNIPVPAQTNTSTPQGQTNLPSRDKNYSYSSTYKTPVNAPTDTDWSTFFNNLAEQNRQHQNQINRFMQELHYMARAIAEQINAQARSQEDADLLQAYGYTFQQSEDISLQLQNAQAARDQARIDLEQAEEDYNNISFFGWDYWFAGKAAADLKAAKNKVKTTEEKLEDIKKEAQKNEQESRSKRLLDLKDKLKSINLLLVAELHNQDEEKKDFPVQAEKNPTAPWKENIIDDIIPQDLQAPYTAYDYWNAFLDDNERRERNKNIAFVRDFSQLTPIVNAILNNQNYESDLIKNKELLEACGYTFQQSEELSLQIQNTQTARDQARIDLEQAEQNYNNISFFGWDYWVAGQAAADLKAAKAKVDEIEESLKNLQKDVLNEEKASRAKTILDLKKRIKDIKLFLENKKRRGGEKKDLPAHAEETMPQNNSIKDIVPNKTDIDVSVAASVENVDGKFRRPQIMDNTYKNKTDEIEELVGQSECELIEELVLSSMIRGDKLWRFVNIPIECDSFFKERYEKNQDVLFSKSLQEEYSGNDGMSAAKNYLKDDAIKSVRVENVMFDNVECQQYLWVDENGYSIGGYLDPVDHAHSTGCMWANAEKVYVGSCDNSQFKSGIGLSQDQIFEMQKQNHIAGMEKKEACAHQKQKFQFQQFIIKSENSAAMSRVRATQSDMATRIQAVSRAFLAGRISAVEAYNLEQQIRYEHTLADIRKKIKREQNPGFFRKAVQGIKSIFRSTPQLTPEQKAQAIQNQSLLPRSGDFPFQAQRDKYNQIVMDKQGNPLDNKGNTWKLDAAKKEWNVYRPDGRLLGTYPQQSAATTTKKNEFNASDTSVATVPDVSAVQEPQNPTTDQVGTSQVPASSEGSDSCSQEQKDDATTTTGVADDDTVSKTTPDNSSTSIDDSVSDEPSSSKVPPLSDSSNHQKTQPDVIEKDTPAAPLPVDKVENPTSPQQQAPHINVQPAKKYQPYAPVHSVPVKIEPTDSSQETKQAADIARYASYQGKSRASTFSPSVTPTTGEENEKTISKEEQIAAQVKENYKHLVHGQDVLGQNERYNQADSDDRKIISFLHDTIAQGKDQTSVELAQESLHAFKQSQVVDSDEERERLTKKSKKYFDALQHPENHKVEKLDHVRDVRLEQIDTLLQGYTEQMNVFKSQAQDSHQSVGAAQYQSRLEKRAQALAATQEELKKNQLQSNFYTISSDVRGFMLANDLNYKAFDGGQATQFQHCLTQEILEIMESSVKRSIRSDSNSVVSQLEYHTCQLAVAAQQLNQQAQIEQAVAVTDWTQFLELYGQSMLDDELGAQFEAESWKSVGVGAARALSKWASFGEKVCSEPGKTSQEIIEHCWGFVNDVNQLAVKVAKGMHSLVSDEDYDLLQELIARHDESKPKKGFVERLVDQYRSNFKKAEYGTQTVVQGVQGVVEHMAQKTVQENIEDITEITVDNFIYGKVMEGVLATANMLGKQAVQAAQSFDDLIPPSMKGSPVHFATTTTGEVIAIAESTGENLATAMNVQASINRVERAAEIVARGKRLSDTIDEITKPNPVEVERFKKSIEPYLNSEKIINPERLKAIEGVDQVEKFRTYTDNFTNLEKLTPEEILYLNLCDWLEPQARLINERLQKCGGLKIVEIRDGIKCTTEIHEFDLFHSLLGEMRPGSIRDHTNGGHLFIPELRAAMLDVGSIEVLENGFFDMGIKYKGKASTKFVPNTYFPTGKSVEEVVAMIEDAVLKPQEIKAINNLKNKDLIGLQATNKKNQTFMLLLEGNVAQFYPYKK